MIVYYVGNLKFVVNYVITLKKNVYHITNRRTLMIKPKLKGSFRSSVLQLFNLQYEQSKPRSLGG